ncbi:uncharacterized protein LOC122076610 isoform X2 [Macadamia integrifolia]|uniref:uncharacterized protein LOC122076610 isoform X2 n=1 Tax=Macadamia integrifolia TaxID=60698 RepID=UPI001C4E69AC|nr:uncharacterized protein LOC122076610 isoform X2 [Macadamia integrifolia]
MWFELLCGLVSYRLIRRFFYGDDIDELESSDSDAKFMVASRIEKLYGGKVYLGLRIPDADTGTRQNIDMVLVTKGELMVVSVKNFSGLVGIDDDGTWIRTDDAKHKTERYPDPVLETKRQVAILQSYLEQRGVTFPEGYISGRVVLPNPNCRIIYSTNFPSEVIPFDKWVELEPEPRNLFSGWIKGAFRGGKKAMQDGIQQKLHFILSTAPMWDRLELKDNKKSFLGEFLQFKGKREDMEVLRIIKRSKVSRLVIQKSAMFRFGFSKLQLLYSPRDYRSEGVSTSEWKDVNVRPNTEVLFQPQGSDKVCKLKLSSIASMSLSA